MNRAFSLTGLLRLRHLQQDEAAGALAAANRNATENSAHRTETHSALANTPVSATTSAALNAMAAARASSRSMLADLDGLGRNYAVAVGEAQNAFDVARAQSIGLEKLETRHSAAWNAEELHGEQTALDEIASARWHRDQAGAAR